MTGRRAACAAALVLLALAPVRADSPEVAARRDKLQAAGVTFSRPVFCSVKSVHAALGLDPNHRALLELLFKNLKGDKTSPNPFAGARTCAVVGNSGNLKGAGYGREIDRHDAVIRMNDAPTAGHEADVGTKTTIVIAAPAKMPVITGPTVHYITYCDQIPETLMTLNNVLTDHIANRFKSVHILDTRFFQSLKRYTGSRPSTGLAAVFLAMNACDRVDLYGFGKSPQGEWDHYYTTSTWNPSNFHDVAGEEKTLKELAAKKLVIIHPGRR